MKQRIIIGIEISGLYSQFEEFISAPLNTNTASQIPYAGNTGMELNLAVDEINSVLPKF